nr:reverse transcriptase domain-containing protein [Tanacetum cinerariifolium]
KPVAAKVSTNTSTSGISPDVAELKVIVKALLLDKKGQSPAPVKAVEESCVTCGGAHSYRNCPAIDGNIYRDNIQEFVSQASALNYNQGNTSYRPPMMSNQILPPGFPPAPAYQAPAPQAQGVSKEDFLAYVKANDAVMRNMQTQATTTQCGVSYDGPQIPPSTSFLPKVVGNIPEATKDTVNPTNNGSTEDLQPQVVQSESPVLISKPVTSPISEPVISLVSASKPNPKTSIPYPSRRNNEGDREKANNQIEKFYHIFKDMSFEIRLSLLDLTPTRMTLELADRSISCPVRVVEDVYVKVGSFYFLAEFVVVDFDADPRVPLIHGRSFLKTERALIDVFEDDPTSPEFYQPYLDPEGGILLLKVFLNVDPSLPPPNQGNYLSERVCIDYRKLNEATRKDHFPLSFMDQMLERLAGNQYYCFLNDFSGYFQIPIDPKDLEKTSFTYPYETFAYRRMPFGLCNAPGTFQRCMMAIFHDMIEKIMEVFMDDFSVFRNSFQSCLSNLERMLKRCEDTNLCLNWEKGHFMVKEGIVLGYKISKQQIKVDKAKVDVITKLPQLKTEGKLTEAPILIAPDWDMSFELMCDASDFAIGAVLGQRQDKHFRLIHYAKHSVHGPFRPQVSVCKERFKGEIALMGSSPPGIHL